MKLNALPLTISSLVLTLLLDVAPTLAVTFPIMGRSKSSASKSLNRRMVDMTGSFNNGSTTLSNQGDLSYYCNITIGGSVFEVLIDTGSSDLWVAGDVKETKNLSIPAAVHYAIGEASGFINTATLHFDDFVIPDQAYIKVNPSQSNPVGQGLIGLGPNSGSNVRALVKTSAGNAPLDRIFRQNLTTPNFLSVLLSRSSDDAAGPDAIAQYGQITVGEIIPGLEAITNEPKLPALKDQFGIQHWQAVMDANGIIGPDGQQINTTTTVPDQKNVNELHVIFDTGFSLPQVTRDVADAIYGRIPGAQFVPQSGSPGYWSYPCDYELNITFLFAGKQHPIHPLDLSLVETTDSDGKPVTCGSTFQEISPDVANHQQFGAFDMILGMAFLRNTYTLIDFGDFVDGSAANVADPYIQLLSITNPADGHSDFVKIRLNGVDTTASQPALLPPDQGQRSPNDLFTDNDGSKNSTGNRIKKLVSGGVWVIIGAVVAGIVALALLCALVMCLLRRRRRPSRTGPGYLNSTVPAVPAMGSYKPLHTPGRPDSPVWDHHASAQYPQPQTHGAGYGYSEPAYQYGHA